VGIFSNWRGRKADPAPKTVSKGPDFSAVLGLFESLRSRTEVQDLSQALADALVNDFGFRAASLRLLNPRTLLFEPRAFSGCAPAELERLSTTDVSERQLKSLHDFAVGCGRGFCIPAGEKRWREQFGGRHTRIGVFPFSDDGERWSGYFAGPLLDPDPPEETLRTLALIAEMAATEFGRVRVGSALQRREVEYAIVREQLSESRALRENLVANVSHELRTPLTSIKAYAETLQRTSGDIDRDIQAEFVQVILNESERLEQAFADLIDTAQNDRRRMHTARDRFDLMDLVEVIASESHAGFAAKGLGLRIFGPNDRLDLQGDPDSLRQLIENLLNNARKFTNSGEVQVHLSEQRGIARIAVSDTGIGLERTELRRIFDRFYQVDGSATREFGGQGLGLALCREIVARHNGRIWAESDGEDQGSRFIVELPVRGFVSRNAGEDRDAVVAERLEWESFLQLSMQFVSELLHTRVASLMLVDEARGVLRVEAAVGLEADVVHQTALGPGEGVAGKVWSSGKPILVPDLDADPRFASLANDADYPARSLLSVPLHRDGTVVGVVNVNARLDGHPFDADDELMLVAVAQRLIRALDGFEKYRRAWRRVNAVEAGVEALLEVGRDRASRLREELARVGTATARRLDLDHEHLGAVAYALRTYDLGLSAIDAELLRKSETLSAAERARVQEHTRTGAELMDGLEPSPQVKRIILHHHENADGSGYPDGLSGEAIPLGSRIVRLVDTTSAVLQDRPARETLDLDAAIELLRNGVGREFCPRIAPTFLECLAERADAIARILAPEECPSVSSERSIEVTAVRPVVPH
jgi:signal transduction histidine kinase/putative methionine-R-sulfoxide reductase with GAF domain